MAKKLDRDAARVVEAASGAIDVAVVLGTGLSAAFETAMTAEPIPYADFETLPSSPLAGHAGHAFAGSLHAARVLVLAGRSHLYQGFSARDVTAGVRLAAAAGARTIVLTNAAGALDPGYAPGDVALIADHINLTGCNPLGGEDPHFTDMGDAYARRLRRLVAANAPGDAPREAVYAGVAGPSFETAAEARYLRTIGADLVGMSTVLETIQARALGMDVLGLSAVTNALDGAPVKHEEVAEIARAAGGRVAALVATLIDNLA